MTYPESAALPIGCQCIHRWRHVRARGLEGPRKKWLPVYWRRCRWDGSLEGQAHVAGWLAKSATGIELRASHEALRPWCLRQAFPSSGASSPRWGWGALRAFAGASQHIDRKGRVKGCGIRAWRGHICSNMQHGIGRLQLAPVGQAARGSHPQPASMPGRVALRVVHGG
eukprot:scaffold22131_cov30-Tisochrysis_lutea.AAC.4